MFNKGTILENHGISATDDPVNQAARPANKSTPIVSNARSVSGGTARSRASANSAIPTSCYRNGPFLYGRLREICLRFISNPGQLESDVASQATCSVKGRLATQHSSVADLRADRELDRQAPRV